MRRAMILFAIWALTIVAIAGCKPGVGETVSELTYSAPLEVAISAGEELSGTPISYVGLSDKGAEVVVAGQSAFKQKGDSLDWRGSPAEDVESELALRVIWYSEETLHVGGMARVTVHDPKPVPGSITTSPIEYHAPVAYTVSQGDRIPGTTIEYLGKTEKGAELDGVEGYPYRKLGDSIVWEGQLRENVFFRLNLRALYIAGDSLRLGGVATIWVIP